VRFVNIGGNFLHLFRSKTEKFKKGLLGCGGFGGIRSAGHNSIEAWVCLELSCTWNLSVGKTAAKGKSWKAAKLLVKIAKAFPSNDVLRT